MDNEKKEKRFGWWELVFCLFALVFLGSGGITASTLIAHHKADKAIQELRVQVQGSLHSDDSTDANAAQQPEKPEGTDATAEETEPAAKEKTPERQISMDFTELLKTNSDIKGWIYGEATNVDYPVLQTDNNDFYMDHLYNKEANSSGSIFADYRNQSDFSDRNTVLYGHHMGNGTMFGSIEHYASQDFYDATPTMKLYTPEGDYLIELICGTHESGDEQFVEFNFKSEEDFMKYVDSFRARSTFKSDVQVQPGDKLISLCTCAYVFDNARYMLMGRLVPLYVEENAAKQPDPPAASPAANG